MCVEVCALCAAIIAKSGANVAVPIGEGIVQCVEECDIGAALGDEGGAVVAVPIGEAVMQCGGVRRRSCSCCLERCRCSCFW